MCKLRPGWLTALGKRGACSVVMKTTNNFDFRVLLLLQVEGDGKLRWCLVFSELEVGGKSGQRGAVRKCCLETPFSVTRLPGMG